MWEPCCSEELELLAGGALSLDELAASSAWVLEQELVEAHALASGLLDAGLCGLGEVEGDDGHLLHLNQTLVVCDGGGGDDDLVLLVVLDELGEGHDWAVGPGEGQTPGDLLGKLVVSQVLGGIGVGLVDGTEVEVLGLRGSTPGVSLLVVSGMVDGHISTRSGVALQAARMQLQHFNYFKNEILNYVSLAVNPDGQCHFLLLID